MTWFTILCRIDRYPGHGCTEIGDEMTMNDPDDVRGPVCTEIVYLMSTSMLMLPFHKVNNNNKVNNKLKLIISARNARLIVQVRS